MQNWCPSLPRPTRTAPFLLSAIEAIPLIVIDDVGDESMSWPAAQAK